GLEDALVNVRADGGDAQVRGQLLFTPDGTINVDVTGTGQPTIDIEMERGEVQNVGELNETERRFTPLPDHELIEIDAPRELPLGGQQTPFQVDVGNAVSALLDGGQLSLNIPMEQSESGRFTLNMVETEDDGDRVGTRIHVDRLASGAGNANFNLVFDGEGEDSRLNAERSGITFTEPVELNLAFQHYFNGPVQLPIPEGNVYTTQGRIRGVSFEETGNGNVRVVPDIEIDSFRTSPFLDVGPLLNTDWVRSQVGEQLGSALVSQPLFGRDTLPQERDALIGALREGAFAHALDPQAAQSEGPRPAPRPVQEATVQPLALTPDQMIAEAFPELPPVDTDLEGDLLRLAEERTAGMSERERENLLVAVRRINQVFELDGTTLRVRDSDGEGPLSVGDRRLDLGNGQFIDLAPGTELEVDIDPQTGLVMRGRAQIDEIKVGDEGDDLHVEVGPLSAQFELRVAPVEGENEPLTAFTLRDFSGEIGRIRTNLNNGIIDVEDASIGAHPDNTFTLSVGGGRELTTRFYLPEIERAQASYQSDLSLARPDWEGARLDIRSSTIRNASILFDGQSL
ncbi:MAG: hypothetical protein AAFY60_11450, partial [Myxococcota bacterium]